MRLTSIHVALAACALSLAPLSQANPGDDVCFGLYRDAGAIPNTSDCPFSASTADFGLSTYYCGNTPPVQRYCGQVLRNDCASNVGHPIDSSNGNKHLTDRDYQGGGTFPLVLERYYNSSALADTTGSFGKQWRSTLDRRVKLSRTNKAYAVRPDGRVHYYTYAAGAWTGEKDVNDELTRQVDTAGVTTGWTLRVAASGELETYDAKGALVSIKSRAGQLQTVTLSDASTPIATAPRAGLPIAVTDHFGRQLKITWDSKARIASITTPDNHVYQYGYDSDGRLVTVTYPEVEAGPSSKQYLYGEPAYTSGASLPNVLTGIIDENGNRLATYTFDSVGRGIGTEYAGGADRYQLTFGSNSATIVDPLSSSRVYTFTQVAGALRLSGVSQPGGAGCAASSRSLTYDANANLTARTDFRGVQTTYTYDMARNLETSRTEAVGTPEARTITTQWHPVFQLRTKVAEPKLLTTYTYDANGNLLTQTEQATSDATGAQGFAATASGAARTTKFTYNSAGQVLTVTGPRTDIVDRTTYTYDSATGNLATVTNAAGHVTHYDEYDGNGRPTRITEASGVTTRLAYAPRGWLLSSERRSADGVLSESTTFTYYPSGHLKTATFPNGGALTYSYDSAQRLTGIADSAGNTITYTLDNMGNRTLETVSDASGTLARKIARAYDALNRLQQQTGGAQ